MGLTGRAVEEVSKDVVVESGVIGAGSEVQSLVMADSVEVGAAVCQPVKVTVLDQQLQVPVGDVHMLGCESESIKDLTQVASNKKDSMIGSEGLVGLDCDTILNAREGEGCEDISLAEGFQWKILAQPCLAEEIASIDGLLLAQIRRLSGGRIVGNA
ncbi:hypothetical protein GUJ93_ZPchr0007g5344 [Zizania palustris]|uniref:Uncharacterized protein n=1 Tax=Zizania palustris TaxID=103762 RepID=A0A8J5T860_ZIZPA|nr:hypothetical protein GUJ93_ZPchr0007g5344 [Zizania palustris]